MHSIQRTVQPEPQNTIIRLRGQAVILDSDLAALYDVTVKRLNQQVSRNHEGFPDDFCFQLTEAEWGKPPEIPCPSPALSLYNPA
jgi:hypothetical protein